MRHWCMHCSRHIHLGKLSWCFTCFFPDGCQYQCTFASCMSPEAISGMEGNTWGAPFAEHCPPHWISPIFWRFSVVQLAHAHRTYCLGARFTRAQKAALSHRSLLLAFEMRFLLGLQFLCTTTNMAAASTLANLQLLRIRDIAYYAAQTSTVCAVLKPERRALKEVGSHYRSLMWNLQPVHLDKHGDNIETESGPCTVITKALDSPVTSEFLQETIDRFSALDDVWSAAFLESVIFVGSKDLSLTDGALHLARTYDVKNVYTSTESQEDGPYLLSHGSLHKIYRLYADTAEAFITSTIQSANNSQS